VSHSDSAVQGNAKRHDIQALRAIAVVLVILDHMTLLQRLPGHPEGGFIGVDIFFVLSGFLITGGLIREASATGRISYAGFYSRRARRILPMAVVVAVVAIIASYVVFWSDRAWTSLVDGFWSLLFLSNVRFAVSGTDYFAQTTPSVFQHYWSLSVEEQFYVVWPLLITAGAFAAVKWQKKLVPILIGIMVIVGLASFTWALLDTSASPASAYFSTFNRAFEFVLGALVAISVSKLSELPNPVRHLMRFVGLAGIAASVLLIVPGNGFPGPWALAPALSAAIIVAAGSGADRTTVIWPLNTKLVGYIGDISYSLYLWHWPVIVVLGALIPANSVVSIVVVIFSTAALSTVSYHWIEQPVLRSNWLRARAERKARPNMRPVRAVSMVAASLVLVSGVFAGSSLYTHRGAEVVRGVPMSDIAPSALSPALDALQEDVSFGLHHPTWDGLTPSIGTLASADGDGELEGGCWNDRTETRDHCIIGPVDAANTVVVFGDSLAMNWIPGLTAALESMPDWNISLYAKVGCPYALGDVYDTDGSLYGSCGVFRSWAIDQINNEAPARLILASGLKKELPGASTASQIPEIWGAGVAATMDSLDFSTPVILSAPPEGKSLVSCANRFTTPSMCGSSTTTLWAETVRSTRDSAPSAEVVDVGMWFCDSDGSCPAVVGNIPVRRDVVHMTDAYSRHLAPLLRELVGGPAS
jgi:peptidoglycan/LPS O-acetylase OafA/YrhL